VTSYRSATWHPAIRDRRRTLRYRHLLVRQMVQMKNRISGLLMETGVSHNEQRLHKVGYFRELLTRNFRKSVSKPATARL
jgi:transposase